LKKNLIKVGGGSGYWGDASMATKQLLSHEDLDFIVYDYLAEITMAIMARAKEKNESLGYATDFIEEAMLPNLKRISDTKTKIISNAGGVNPTSCGKVLREIIKGQKLDLKVAVIEGDNLIEDIDQVLSYNPIDMFSGAKVPPKDKISSINAYFGAKPIVEALKKGADIVVTGRCVDSAVTLAACAFSFDWDFANFDLMASGSLVGHLLECGTQITGGNFTDWKLVKGSFDQIGYPIAEISADGQSIITKVKDTGGLVSVGTVAEQMLYEIGNPREYLLPDVGCDFTNVTLSEVAPDRVLVKGAKGNPPSYHYKVCMTYNTGFRGGHLFGFYGSEASEKANAFAKAAVARARKTLKNKGLADFEEESIEILGSGSQFGIQNNFNETREVFAKIAVKHPDPRGVGVLLKDAFGLALSSPPGLCGFAGARPKPSPILSLFSFMYDKKKIKFKIIVADNEPEEIFIESRFDNNKPKNLNTFETFPETPRISDDHQSIEVSLEKLAWGRSGDKGNKSNIGIIARKPEFLPYIWKYFDEDRIRDVFKHFLADNLVDRFYLSGTHSINYVLHNVLGGGGTTSLRNDPQGKGYGQILLASKLEVPKSILGDIEDENYST